MQPQAYTGKDILAKGKPMDTEIQQFYFRNAALRILTDEAGESWFVAKDVCDILGLENSRKATAELDSDEKNTVTISDGIAGNPNKTIISEPGLYRLVMKSRKPEAKEFQRWVTHEVLPSISKHGAYMTRQTLDKALTSPDFLIELANRLKDEQAKVRELEPKARALDDFTSVPDALLIRDAAKLLSNTGTPIGEHELREWLLEHGWIFKQGGKAWCASMHRVRSGHMVMVASLNHGIHKDGTPFAYPPTPKLTRKGLTLLHQRLSEQAFNEQLNETTNDR